MNAAAVRRLVPATVRRLIGGRRASGTAARIERELDALARHRGPIVAGPWLGEVGFELLYWVPFLAWFAERYAVAPGRLTVISRGGTREWYHGIAAYHDVFEAVDAATFRSGHEARIRELGEQKQRQSTAFDGDLVAAISARAGLADAQLLHPSTMFELMSPYWWGHADEDWVFRYARYRRLPRPSAPADVPLPASYSAVKFYFNDCFPDTPANRRFVEAAVDALAQEGPVVSLNLALQVDEHHGPDVAGRRVTTVPHIDATRNLAVQSAVVAGARQFAGTYGGFSYLAPFYGVPTMAYYADAGGFSARHLTLARAALASIGAGGLLQIQDTVN
ncbi:MAG: hypothetical protein AB7P21_31640 [Lautropia sp.]